MRLIAPLALVLVVGCAPGVSPSSAWSGLLGDVKADMAAGDQLPQIEATVATDLKIDVSPMVDTIVVDVVDVLEIGLAVDPALAESIKAQATKKVAAAKAERK